MHHFTSTFFKKNRDKLSKVLPNSLVVLTAHSLIQKSADTTFPFRQDSSFWYMSGIDEPDILLVLNTKNGTSTLLVPEQNDYQKEWDGNLDFEALKTKSGVDLVDASESLEYILKKAKKSNLSICSLEPLAEKVEPYGFYSNPARRKLYERIKSIEPEPKEIRLEIARLRQVKQLEELTAIQSAIDITAETLKEVKKNLRHYQKEKDIERSITAGFYDRGANGHAYEPIIASGKNASIIHYMKNDAKLQENSLLLLDVGAQVHGYYAADISRTWAFGKSTERHRALYTAVLTLQEKAFSMLRPGVLLKEYQEELEVYAKKVFLPLGVKINRYPHGFSHFLGLDVHDAGDYGAPLPEGSVITVEPGIYLPDEGIGIRMEDNVLITKNGIKNLSSHIPKTL